jgi:hypothetical protein
MLCLLLSLALSECDFCMMLTDEVIDFVVLGFSDSDIIASFSQACSAAPADWSQPCQDYVRFLPIVLQDIRNGESTYDICADLGYCAQAPPRRYLPTDRTCNLCYSIVARTTQLSKCSMSPIDMIPVLSQTCDSFQGQMRSKCVQLTTVTVPFMVRFIQEGIPDKICESFAFCGSRLKPRIPNLRRQSKRSETCADLVDFIRTNQDSVAIGDFCEKVGGQTVWQTAALCLSIAFNSRTEILKGIETGANSLSICGKIGFPILRDRTAVKGDYNCDLCIKLVQYVEAALVDTKVVDTIITVVSGQCDRFPGAYVSLCEAMVVQYVPQIVQLIEQGLGDTDICPSIGYCINP